MSRIGLNPLGNGLGDYLREQRQSARLSLRQLADLAGISNPYLSQIERGLKRPSAEILQQLAKGLEVSAESLYVQAGILDERHGGPSQPDTREVISADPRLNQRQKAAMLDIYDSFVGPKPASPARAAATAKRAGAPRKTASARKTATASKAAAARTSGAAQTSGAKRTGPAPTAAAADTAVPTQTTRPEK